ncbi:hypothetical protein LTR95_004655 [Oleoguttula sp. CCFEE 5521]
MADPRHSISGNTAAKPPRTQRSVLVLQCCSQAESSVTYCVIDADSGRFRRPDSTDTSEFWHISQADWNALLLEAGNPGTRSSARKKLRVVERVAELMEQTKVSQSPGLPSIGAACRVARDARSMACAKCMKSRKPCEAGSVMQRGLQEQQESASAALSRTRDSLAPDDPRVNHRSLEDAEIDHTRHESVPQASEEKDDVRSIRASAQSTMTATAKSESGLHIKHENGTDDDLVVLYAQPRSQALGEEQSARRLKRQRQREEDLADDEIEVLKLKAKAARLAMEAEVFAAQSEAKLMRAVYERKKSIECRR